MRLLSRRSIASFDGNFSIWKGSKFVRRRRSVASQPYRLFSKRTTPLPLLQLANLVARTTILARVFGRIHTQDTVDRPMVYATSNRQISNSIPELLVRGINALD